MKSLGNQKGFTLIELIIVIVVLGILAAIAIPKYVSFKTEAAKGVAYGAAAALNGSSTILFAKDLMAGNSGISYGTDGLERAKAEVNGVQNQGFTINTPPALHYTTLNVAGVTCKLDRSDATANFTQAYWQVNASVGCY